MHSKDDSSCYVYKIYRVLKQFPRADLYCFKRHHLRSLRLKYMKFFYLLFLYDYENWPHILQEKYKSKAF